MVHRYNLHTISELPSGIQVSELQNNNIIQRKGPRFIKGSLHIGISKGKSNINTNSCTHTAKYLNVASWAKQNNNGF